MVGLLSRLGFTLVAERVTFKRLGWVMCMDLGLVGVDTGTEVGSEFCFGWYLEWPGMSLNTLGTAAAGFSTLGSDAVLCLLEGGMAGTCAWVPGCVQSL